jgi:transposase InsO family protein
MALTHDTLRFADRLFLAGVKRPPRESVARQAVHKAARLLALALGQQLAEARSSHDPLQRAQARIRELEIQLRLALDLLEIVAARWDKLPEHRRPHYTPQQRWLILHAARLRGDSAAEIAHTVRVSVNTIRNWTAELALDPERQTVGSLVKPVPPVRRYSDSVRHLVQVMARLGFASPAEIAGTLVRAGWTLAAQTARRILAEPPARTPPPPTSPRRPVGADTLEPARRPNQRWILDITQVKACFGLLSFRVAALLDAFSRLPLAARAFRCEPSAADMTALVRTACRRHGPAQEIVTDCGGQFQDQFRRAMERLGIRHRFGRLGQSHSLPLIERFWRTLKQGLRVPWLRPLTLADLEERLGYAVLHYGFFRPHSALSGATPAEAFFGWPPGPDGGVSPPRGSPGEPSPPLPVRIAALDPQGQHPILVKAA